MKKLLLLIAISALVLNVSVCFAASPEKKAERASSNWLQLVDGKKYAASYDEAASFFKAMIGKDDWIKMLGNLRGMLGEVVSRKLVTSKYETEMEGAPDGEYVILIYKTKFSKKADANEVVVPMLDKDGKWRVSGYHVK